MFVRCHSAFGATHCQAGHCGFVLKLLPLKSVHIFCARFMHLPPFALRRGLSPSPPPHPALKYCYSRSWFQVPVPDVVRICLSFTFCLALFLLTFLLDFSFFSYHEVFFFSIIISLIPVWCGSPSVHLFILSFSPLRSLNQWFLIMVPQEVVE